MMMKVIQPVQKDVVMWQELVQLDSPGVDDVEWELKLAEMPTGMR